MKVNESGYTFFFQKLKQSRPGLPTLTVVLKPYLPDASLSVVKTLEEYMYLRRTEPLRGEETQLFISCNKPHKKVTKETISRWIKQVMLNSGIDISLFKPHSTRAAAVSAAAVLVRFLAPGFGFALG